MSGPGTGPLHVPHLVEALAGGPAVDAEALNVAHEDDLRRHTRISHRRCKPHTKVRVYLSPHMMHPLGHTNYEAAH